MVASGIQSIPWMYDGIPFRSKLEARWYAIFKLDGWSVEYEPETFALHGVYENEFIDNYLPDFLISSKQQCYYVEIKPLLARGMYPVRDLATMRNAYILGFSRPTILLLGSPRKYFGCLCEERHKGCPSGLLIGDDLRPLGDWYLSHCYPDEIGEGIDPREACGWDDETYSHRLYATAEHCIQWHGRRQ